MERRTSFPSCELVLHGMPDKRIWPRTKEQQGFLDLMTSGYLDATNKKIYASRVIEDWLKQWPESDLIFGKPAPDDRPLTDEQKHHRSLILGQAIEKRREACLLPSELDCTIDNPGIAIV